MIQVVLTVVVSLFEMYAIQNVSLLSVLSREVLCQDVVSVVQTLFGSSTPRIVLMGHR